MTIPNGIVVYFKNTATVLLIRELQLERYFVKNSFFSRICSLSTQYNSKTNYMATSDSKLPWGIKSQTIQPGSMKTITDTKLATFAVGTQFQNIFDLWNLSS